MQSREVLFGVIGILVAATAIFWYETGSHHGVFYSPLTSGRQAGIKNSGPQSPVRVVGGSIKLRASAGWNNCAAAAPPCVVTATPVATSALYLDGIGLPVGNSSEEPTGWIGAGNFAWTVKVWARGVDKTKKGKGGISICTSDNTGVCASGAAPGQYIAISTMGSSNGSASDTIGLTLEAMDTNAGLGYRYFDTAATSQNFYEYIHSIEIQNVDSVTANGTSTYAYKCPDGACDIYIGQ
jgi:hypothetical protein